MQENKFFMAPKFEVRRLSFYIFLFVIICAIIVINIELKQSKNDTIKIEQKIFSIEKVEKKDKSTRYYSGKYMILPQYGDENTYFVGDIIIVSGISKNLLSEKDNTYSLYQKSRGYDYKLIANNIEKFGYEKSFARVIDVLRNNMINAIDHLYVENNHIVRALVVGDRQYITNSDSILFSRAGISHIISISGFHVVLIGNIFFSMLFFLSKKMRYVLSAVFTLFYVVLTGYNPPCIRAYMFYITYIASIILCKRYDVFSVGFLLASFYMAINPFILFDAGFCLSFMAVFSIAMFYRYLDRFFKRVLLRLGVYEKESIFTYISSLVSLTISANVLTLPYVYYNFGVLSMVNILTNIVSVPVIAISYPFILLSMLFVKLDFISKVFANIVDFFMNIFFGANEFFTKLPFAYIEFEKRHIQIIIVFYIFLFIFYHLFIKNIVAKNIINKFKEIQ